jgi:hypothetical protein
LSTADPVADHGGITLYNDSDGPARLVADLFGCFA